MSNLKETIEYIVKETLKLNTIHIPNESVEINYSAIFCQYDKEYQDFFSESSKIGSIIEDTTTGPLFKFDKPLETPAGLLWLLKVRKPDVTRPERGDADYTLKDYYAFKDKYFSDKEHFKIIDRGNFEMIELMDKKFNVRSYFSNIPLILQLNIK